MTALGWILHVALLLLAPLPLLGVIGKVKSWFAGRSGPPLLQPAWDIIRLLRKGAVYSRTTTWVFVAGPIVSLATALAAGLLVPFAADSAPLAFSGDVVAFAFLLGLGRFLTMAAALDTGSAFEGMGASREATFSAIAEPALILCLLALCVPGRALSFGDAFAQAHASGHAASPALLVAAFALGAVLLAEASRIPVDDPNTHLELTMVHEVMVLDHSGPDFAFIQYGYAVKLFVLSALLVRFALPIPAGGTGAGAGALAMFLGGQVAVAAGIGVVESVMARLRLPRVPQFLIGACVVAAIALVALLAGARP